MDDNQRRKAQIEEKKRELARLKLERQQREHQRHQAPAHVNGQNGAQENGNGMPNVASADNMNDLLELVGIPAERQTLPPNASAPSLVSNGFSKSVGTEGENEAAPPNRPLPSSEFTFSRPTNLEVVHTANISVPSKSDNKYTKATQTVETEYHNDNFSTGSRDAYEFDDMSLDDKHDLEDMSMDDTSPSHMISKILGKVQLHGNNDLDHHHHHHEHEPKEHPQVIKVIKPPELTTEQKEKIVQSDGFRKFIDKTSRWVERLIATEALTDPFVDYKSGVENAHSDALLTPKGRFNGEEYVNDQVGIGVDFSDAHPELMVVAVNGSTAGSEAPTSVVNIWNVNFPTKTPEVVFHCYSNLTSVCFSKFHPKVVIGGCDTGQLCVWDMRDNKMSPVNRSQISSRGHTQAIMDMKVVGTQHASELITCSLDGVMCWWTLENLHSPEKKITTVFSAKKTLPITCFDVFATDVNKFVVGAEDGFLYWGDRQAEDGKMSQELQAHDGPINSIALHKTIGPIDFTNYCLTSSSDFDIKLWNLQEPSRPVLTFRNKHNYSYITDAKWSPVHPGVFVSTSLSGVTLLWNLNQCLDDPVAEVNLGEPIQKILWSKDGHQVSLMDGNGGVQIFDVHESLYNVKQNEWDVLASVLYESVQDSKPLQFEEPEATTA